MGKETTEQKIDYIFDTLKKQESRHKRWLYFKWGFRIFIVIYLYYFIMVWLPWIMNNFKDSITPNISKSLESIDKDELMEKFKSLYNK